MTGMNIEQICNNNERQTQETATSGFPYIVYTHHNP